MGPPHPLVLVLCRYDERGHGKVYREGDCAFWFSSAAAWAEWVKGRPLPEKFYVYPLRNLSAQLNHLRLFQKDGITSIRYPDGRTIAIGELISAVQSASA